MRNRQLWEEQLDGNEHFRLGDRLLIACSGGVDSVALVHLMIERALKWKWTIGIVHVDHQLRGQQSYEDLLFVKKLASRKGVPFYSERINIPSLVQTGGNVQEVCRIERYHYFKRVMACEQYDTLVTAHHANDQLETMLIQLTRGQLMTGMKEVRPFGTGRLLRPLLHVEKEALHFYLQSIGETYREDPSNASTLYLRNALRQQVIPPLVNLRPEVIKNSLQMSRETEEDNDYLMKLAKEVTRGMIVEKRRGFLKVQIEPFRRADVALQRRIIPLLLNYLYTYESHQIAYATTLLSAIRKVLLKSEGQQQIRLPKGYAVYRTYDEATFSKVQARSPLREREVFLETDESFTFGSFSFEVKSNECTHRERGVQCFSLDERPVYVRTRRPGDVIQLEGMKNPKKIRRLLIDEKIPQHLRDEWPLLVDQETEQVLAVPFIRTSKWLPNLSREEDFQRLKNVVLVRKEENIT